MRPTYTADLTKDGTYWLITIRELDIVTQARFDGEIEEMARDLIATMEEIEPDSFDLVVVGGPNTT